MKIGGLQKFSLIDYPAKICAVVFTQGCNFRCPYCHNPELSNPDLYGECIPEEDVLAFLDKRVGKLDAVSISGGEPTLQPDLADFINRIKSMNYLVKLDTNGSNPEILKTLITSGLVDYIAMDVKAPLEKYRKVTRSGITPELIKHSVDMIKKSSIPYEFRTTIVKSQLKEDDLRALGTMIKRARLYVLQKFVPSKVMDPKYLGKKTYSDEEFDALSKMFQKYALSVIIR